MRKNRCSAHGASARRFGGLFVEKADPSNRDGMECNGGIKVVTSSLDFLRAKRVLLKQSESEHAKHFIFNSVSNENYTSSNNF